MAQPETLKSWLTWLEGLSPVEMDLRLSRVQRVLARLDLKRPPLVVTVAGTNGKGSSVALLEAFFRHQGLSVGSYTSPHLIRYNERIKIDLAPAADDQIVAAFAAIEAVRDDAPLTYFEFSTLAAVWLFDQAKVGVAILEVGLGGRLDAVNAINADAMLVTSIGLDHQRWLGDNLESIGAEKASVSRAGRPLVFSAGTMPASIGAVAQAVGAPLFSGALDFFVARDANGWSFHGFGREIAGPASLIDKGHHQLTNAAGVMALLLVLGQPVDADLLNRCWSGFSAPGRVMRAATSPEIVVDVAHNREAVDALVAVLQASPVAGATHVVCGLLRDKAVEATLQPLTRITKSWTTVPTAGERGMSAAELANLLASFVTEPVQCAPGVAEAIATLRETAASDDRIIILGSFTVAGPALDSLGLY